MARQESPRRNLLNDRARKLELWKRLSPQAVEIATANLAADAALVTFPSQFNAGTNTDARPANPDTVPETSLKPRRPKRRGLRATVGLAVLLTLGVGVKAGYDYRFGTAPEKGGTPVTTPATTPSTIAAAPVEAPAPVAETPPPPASAAPSEVSPAIANSLAGTDISGKVGPNTLIDQTTPPASVPVYPGSSQLGRGIEDTRGGAPTGGNSVVYQDLGETLPGGG